MQTKDSKLQIKDIDISKNELAGYFAEFHTVDSYGDITEKGAFTKTIQENGPTGKDLIRWCMNHDMSEKALGSLLSLQEDDFGLFYVGQLGEMIWANELRSMIDCGMNITHSFGYSTVRETMIGGVNRLQEVKMYEGSCISSWSANPNTPLVPVVSTSGLKEQVKQLNDELAPFIKYKSISEAPDESIKQIEDFVKAQEDMFWGAVEKQENKKKNDVLLQIELMKIRM